MDAVLILKRTVVGFNLLMCRPHDTHTLFFLGFTGGGCRHVVTLLSTERPENIQSLSYCHSSKARMLHLFVTVKSDIVFGRKDF